MIVDLDVFMSKADDCFKYYRIQTKKCYFYQHIRYPDDLLGVFSSHLIRMFLSVVSYSLTELCRLQFDEYKLLDVIVSEGLLFLSRFWQEINIEYFYEFFDKIKYVNKSYCFNTKKDKPEFGPYIHSAFDITFQTIYI